MPGRSPGEHGLVKTDIAGGEMIPRPLTYSSDKNEKLFLIVGGKWEKQAGNLH